MSTKVRAVDAAPRTTRTATFWTVRQWWSTIETWTILNNHIEKDEYLDSLLHPNKWTTAPKKVNGCEQKLSWGKAEMPLTPARQTQGDHNKTVRSHLCSDQMGVDLRIRPVQTGETERANQKADVIATHFLQWPFHCVPFYLRRTPEMVTMASEVAEELQSENKT